MDNSIKEKKILIFISEILKWLKIKGNIVNTDAKLGNDISKGMKTKSVSKAIINKHLRK